VPAQKGMTMHIGKLIREQVEKQGKTVVWFARQLSCSRTNVYKIFERPSIDTSLLMRISNILQYNFFNDYRDEVEEKE
jgi:hypothetical protein